MSFQKTIEESIRQLQEWIRFLEAERNRLHGEIRRIQQQQQEEADPSEPQQLDAPAVGHEHDEDEWL